MTIYTGSDLQKKTGEVLSDVQTLGWVKIKNRSRPDMVLMTQDEFDRMLVTEVGGYNKYGLEA